MRTGVESIATAIIMMMTRKQRRGAHTLHHGIARPDRQCKGSNDNIVVKGDTQNQYKHEDDDEDEDFVDVML